MTLRDPHTGRAMGYKVGKSPRDGLWYVLGSCGRSERMGRMVYMRLGRGHTTRVAAADTIVGMHQADCESRAAGLASMTKD